MTTYDFAMANYQKCMATYRNTKDPVAALEWLKKANAWRQLAHQYR